MSGFEFYKKPFIVALVFFVAGILMVAGGFYLAGLTGSMGYYALVAFGVLALITAIVTYFMYRRLEREYQRTLGGDPVLRFTVDASLLAENIERSVKELKSENRTKLFVMLVFCALFAIVLPFFFEDGYLFVYICAGIAVFLSAAALLLTVYGVRRLRKGDNEFILSTNGAYVSGEYHSWGMPGTSLTGIRYQPPAEEEPGLIEIEYTAASIPAEAAVKFSIPVPLDQAPKAEEVVRALEQRAG